MQQKAEEGLMDFVRVNGVTLHHCARPAPAGRPTLVFANSLGTDFRIWDKVVTGLGERCGFVLYDKRGHGLSETGDTPYRMADHVGDLAGLLDHLGVREAVVCGLSVGGMIAQGLHAARPDLVRALVLSNTAHRIGTEVMWNARIKAVEDGGMAAIVGAVLERWFTPAFRRDDNAEFAGCRTMLARTPAQGYAATCAALRDTDYTELAKAISVPTLCIAGTDDGSTPPLLVRELARLVPGARFEEIAGAAHIPCVEQPEKYVALLAGFITGLREAKA